jgi:hypothetical protein
MFDEIDIWVVSDNRSNEIVYLPKYNDVFLIVIDNILESICMARSRPDPLPSDHRSLPFNVQELADVCESITAELEMIPCCTPSVH